MNNKYFYLFFRDSAFRAVFILSVIGILSCLLLIRLNTSTSLALKDIQVKQAIIDHIPLWQAKLDKANVVVVKHLDLILNGVLWNDAKPMVIINNTIVKLGGKIGGKKVSMITKHSATLCDDGSVNKCIKLFLEK